MSFNYEAFEKDLLAAVEAYADSQLENKDDLYMISLEYFPEFTTFVALRANTWSFLEEQTDPSDEDYLYYKYCEEEWDGYEDLEEISETLQEYFEEMEEEYKDDDETYEKLSDEHATKIIEACKNVLKKFKETNTYKEFPKLYLNVYVREYFETEEALAIIQELNGEEILEEYEEWL